MELVKRDYMNFLRKILTIAIVSLTTDISGVQLPAPPVAAAAVGGHVLDFNTIFNLGQFIPTSFSPKIYHPAGYLAVGPNNLKYVYFAIPQNGVIANVAFLRPINNTPPVNIDYNIYFPADGSQPTTPDAVNYSLANIDNRENSPITEWYMKMFGVIPINHAAIAAGGAGAPAPIYVLAGWSHPAPGGGAINAQRIIDYGFMNGLAINLQNLHLGYSALHMPVALPVLNGIAINGIAANQIRNQNKEVLLQFENSLKNTVAAAIGAHAAFANHRPTKEGLGKLLLLLKQMAPGETVGGFSDKLESTFKKNFRKIASTSVGRTLLYRILIEIRRHNIGNNDGMLENSPNIPVPGDPLVRFRNSLRSLTIDFGDYVCRYGDNAIYIENSFLHSCYVVSDISGSGPNGKWDGIVRHQCPADVALFHEMNHWFHALRNIDRLGKEQNRNIIPYGFNSGNAAARLGAYYWNLGGWVNMNVSQSKWGRPNYEEIRNILGVPVFVGVANPIVGTINGDDISENLYRICIGLPLRIGHVDNGLSFYEDSRVVDRIIESCTLQKAYYNCISRPAGRVDFAYGGGVRGLGSGIFPFL